MINQNTSFLYEIQDRKVKFHDPEADEYAKGILAKLQCDTKDGIKEEDFYLHRNKLTSVLLVSRVKDERISYTPAFSDNDRKCLQEVIDELEPVFKLRNVGIVMGKYELQMVLVQEPYTMTDLEYSNALIQSAQRLGKRKEKTRTRKLRKSKQELGNPGQYMQVMAKRLEYRTPLSDALDANNGGKISEYIVNGDRGPIWKGRTQWRHLDPEHLPVCLPEELFKGLEAYYAGLGITAKRNDFSEPEYVSATAIGPMSFVGMHMPANITNGTTKSIRLVDYPGLLKLIVKYKENLTDILPSLKKIGDVFFSDSKKKFPYYFSLSPTIMGMLAYFQFRLLLFIIDGRYRVFRKKDEEIERQAVAMMERIQYAFDVGKFPKELIDTVRAGYAN